MRLHRPGPALLAASVLIATAVMTGCTTTSAGSPLPAPSSTPTGSSTGSPTPGPTGSPTSPTPGPTGTPTAPSGPAGYIHRGDQAVILVRSIEAGVDGIRNVDTTLVLGDGTVIRSGAQGSGYQTFRLSDESVAGLLASAQQHGLLADPDMGEPGVTDTGWDTVVLELADRTVELRIDAPGFEANLTAPQQSARAEYREFLGALAGLDRLPLRSPVAAYQPSRVILVADRVPPPALDGRIAGTAVAWPLAAGPVSLLGTSGCAVISGADGRAVLAAATGPSAYASLIVRSGRAVPQLIRVRPAILLPGDDGCAPAQAPTAPLPAPWPADDRRPPTAVADWVAADAVDRAADANQFGPNVADRARVSHYQLASSLAEVDGRQVVDVVGTPYSTVKPGAPGKFSLRVDLVTGKILKLELA